MPDPATLRAIAANPTPYDGAPPNPQDGAAPAPDEAAADPDTDLGKLNAGALALKEELAALVAKVQDLASDAEMVDELSPKIEKALIAISDAIEKVGPGFDAALELLATAVEDEAALAAEDDEE